MTKSNVATLFSKSIPLMWHTMDGPYETSTGLAVQFMTLNGRSFEAVRPHISKIAQMFGLNSRTMTADDFIAALTNTTDSDKITAVTGLLSAAEYELDLDHPVLAIRRTGGMPTTYEFSKTPAQRWRLTAMWSDDDAVDFSQTQTHVYYEQNDEAGAKFEAHRIQRGGGGASAAPTLFMQKIEDVWTLYLAEGSKVMTAGLALDPKRSYRVEFLPMGTFTGIELRVAYEDDGMPAAGKVLASHIYDALEVQDIGEFEDLFPAGCVDDMLAAAEDKKKMDALWQDALDVAGDALTRTPEIEEALALAHVDYEPWTPPAPAAGPALLPAPAPPAPGSNILTFKAREPKRLKAD